MIKDIAYIRKYVNTMEYWIMKNGINTIQRQQQKQKELLFSWTLSGTLLYNRTLA